MPFRKQLSIKLLQMTTVTYQAKILGITELWGQMWKMQLADKLGNHNSYYFIKITLYFIWLINNPVINPKKEY